MRKIQTQIHGIPTVCYGEESDWAFLFVHGKLGCKEEAEALADVVCPMGAMVIGIDLPGHGERKSEAERFVPWEVVPELQKVYDSLAKRYARITLRANSIGAWFSMIALEQRSIESALLVSPILDMTGLIDNMMRATGVSEAELMERKRIPTRFGETLDWEYYTYAKAHRCEGWNHPTAILYADGDNMTARGTVETFSNAHGCALTVMENGEHWFHTEEQMAVLNRWTAESVKHFFCVAQ